MNFRTRAGILIPGAFSSLNISLYNSTSTRIRQADLVVDSYPYSGHTLTSDAPRTGSPVVTMMGETFASRVAGSLLVGMGEMVAYNDAEYIRVADALLN